SHRAINSACTARGRPLSHTAENLRALWHLAGCFVRFAHSSFRSLPADAGSTYSRTVEYYMVVSGEILSSHPPWERSSLVLQFNPPCPNPGPVLRNRAWYLDSGIDPISNGCYLRRD